MKKKLQKVPPTVRKIIFKEAVQNLLQKPVPNQREPLKSQSKQVDLEEVDLNAYKKSWLI
jgi:hypothetical protein